MKPKYLLIFNLLISLVATSQQIALPGVVSIQNSEYNTGTREYVFEASITADFATDKLTDSQGVFLLEFVSEKNGSATKIKVFKAGLEIVNAKALEDAIIGRTPALNIYMCKEGELAENQVKYHYISLKNLYAERDRRIALLEKGRTTMKAEIERLEEELNTEIYTKKDAILQLHQQIEDLENKLPEFAKKLAIVNLDDASKLYKKAFELYINGNVKEAISLLDIDKLLAKGQETTNSLKSLRKQSQIIIETIALLEKQIEQTVKSLELGAELKNNSLNIKKQVNITKR